MSDRSSTKSNNDIQQPLNVLLWYRRGAGLHFSGPGRTAYRMYAKAAPGRFRLTLVHGFPEHARYELFDQQICLGNCREDIPHQLLFIARASRWLNQHARQYDVFHGLSGYWVTLQPALHAHRLGLPAVVKLIAWRADMADKQRWKTWLGVTQRRRQSLNELDALIAISPAIARELIEYGVSAERIACIPNGVDVELYRPAADDEERQAQRQAIGLPNRPTVLFAGGINRRKQPQLLVEALAAPTQGGPEWQLLLAGPQDDRSLVQQMKQRARELRVSQRVTWLGVQTDMAPLYRAADVFCLPSQLEGLPNAVLESMAAGIPAVVTAIPGSADLVDDGRTGLQVSPDPTEIARAIQTYVDSPQQRSSHGQAARQKVLDQFDATKVLNAHEQLFRLVRSGKAPSLASLF